MKNPITMILDYFRKKRRRKEFEKRQKIYTDAIESIDPKLQKRKADQLTLEVKIEAELLNFYEIDSKAKFPLGRRKLTKGADHIREKFAVEMKELFMSIDNQLVVKCTA